MTCGRGLFWEEGRRVLLKEGSAGDVEMLGGVGEGINRGSVDKGKQDVCEVVGGDKGKEGEDGIAKGVSNDEFGGRSISLHGAEPAAEVKLRERYRSRP